MVYGEISSAGAKRTLLLYGHYDVQPPEPLEMWDTPPFEPSIRNGRIYARGSADNKGQLFTYLKAVEAILKTGRQLSINLKFMFDPEEEIGSPSLRDFVQNNQSRFSADLAYGADGFLDSSVRPIIIFGFRGNCYIEINYQEANRDLHSGLFGGPIRDSNWRMIDFLKTLRDSIGRVAIEGFYDNIVPPTPAEREVISRIPFDEEETLQELGLTRFTEPKGMGFYEKLMFQPTLTICGYSSGYGGEGMKTTMPCRTKVKIDMRLVKNQNPRDILNKFRRHMEKCGFSDMEVKLLCTFDPQKTPIDHPMSKAVIMGVRKAFKKEPIIYPTIGGSAPTAFFGEILEIPFIGVPYGNHDDFSHAPNENLAIDFFIMGIKTNVSVFL